MFLTIFSEHRAVLSMFQQIMWVAALDNAMLDESVSIASRVWQDLDFTVPYNGMAFELRMTLFVVRYRTWVAPYSQRFRA
jgi:hypothetical protein